VEFDGLPWFVRDPFSTQNVSYAAVNLFQEHDRKHKALQTEMAAATTGTPTNGSGSALAPVASSATKLSTSPSPSSPVAPTPGAIALYNAKCELCSAVVCRLGLVLHIQLICPNMLLACQCCGKPRRRNQDCDCKYRDLRVISCNFCHAKQLESERLSHEKRCAVSFEAYLAQRELRRVAQVALEDQAAAAARKVKEDKDKADAAAAVATAHGGKSKTSAPAVAPAQPVQPPLPPEEDFRCPLCNAAFSTRQALLEHVDTCVR